MDWYTEEEYGRDFSSSGEEINEARLVTSWDTSGEDIAEFEQSLKEIFG